MRVKILVPKFWSYWKKYGYTKKIDPVYFQSFDENELKRAYPSLLPKMGMHIKLVQLIAETSWGGTMQYIDGKPVDYSYDRMFKLGAMKMISEYTDAVGAWYQMVVAPETSKDKLLLRR